MKYYIKEWRRYRGIDREKISIHVDYDYESLKRLEQMDDHDEILHSVAYENSDFHSLFERIADMLHLDLHEMAAPPPRLLASLISPMNPDIAYTTNYGPTERVHPTTINVSTEEPGEFHEENRGELLSSELQGHVEYEEGESILVGEEHWKRIRVNVRIPCAKDDIPSAIVEVKKITKEVLGDELEKMNLSLAEQFNKQTAGGKKAL